MFPVSELSLIREERLRVHKGATRNRGRTVLVKRMNDDGRRASTSLAVIPACVRKWGNVRIPNEFGHF